MKAMDAIEPIFQQYIDKLCDQNFAKAKAAWINGMDENKAASYLQNIYPDAKCYEDANALVQEIMKQVYNRDRREWNFKLKQWDDSVSLESQKLIAIKDIGTTYGENQVPYIIKNESFNPWIAK